MKLFKYILFVGIMLVCGGVKGQITINVSSGNSTMCAGSSISFGSVVTCNSTYQWHKNGVPILNATNQGYSTNSLVDGDVITCVQVTTTLPCIKDTSNKITITILPTANITLSSAAVTANQTVCQNTAITQIKYAITGATGATVNNLPTGVTGTYSNGFLIISGTPTQSSTSPFNYTINITGGNCGSNATANGSITVKDAPTLQLEDVGSPFSPFNNCGNNSGIPNYTLTVGNISSNTSTVNSYTLNWGDGNIETNVLSSSFPKTHQYTSFGVFHLTLSTTNSLGCFVSWSKDVVNQTNPAVGIQGPPNGSTQGCAPVGYWFKLTNYSSNTTGTTYNWDFDDNTTLTWTTPLIVDSVFHIFNTSSCNKPTKQFTVSVNAINQCTSTPATIGNIKIFKKPKAKFIVSDSVVCLNTTITFTNNSDLAFNGNDCNTNTLYSWNFGDPASGSLNVSTIKDVSHTYQTSGQFIVILIVKGSCGNDTLTKTICVNPTPTASFTTPKDTLCAGENLSFTSTSNAPLCGNNIYSWSVTKTDIAGCASSVAPTFVSATSSSSANPIMNFSKPGTYVVSLTTTIQGTSCTSVAFTKTITVKDKPTNVSISLSPATICQGSTTIPTVADNCFTNNATYSWAFTSGTPATSNLKSPGAIAFNTAGSNNISIAVTNACGTTTQSTSVTVSASPTLTATPVNANICNGQNATINLSSNQAGIKYSWTSAVISGVASGNNNQPTTITTTSINNTLTNTGIIDAVVRYTITVVGSTGCTGETKTVDITVKPGITSANAGTDQNLCNTATATLAGNNPTVGSGTWTKISGPAATITNSALNNTTVTGLLPGVYLFAWTISGSGGGSCATSSDTVQIINRPIITQANAGSDIIICNFSAINNSVTLQGNTASPSRSYETGTWTVVAKPVGSNASFSNINNPTSTFTFNQIGNYTLAWTITNDINCTPSTDTVIIKVYQAAVGGTTGNNNTVCKGNNTGTITLAGFTGNIVKWQYKVLGSAIWVDVANTTSTISYNNLDTTTTYQAIIATTNSVDCPITATSTQTIITVNPVPSISNLTAISPTQCNTANGSISFNVVPASGNYTVAYTLNGGNQTSNINTGNGVINISNLGVGLYDNIKVTLNGCSSNTLGSVTLSNPNKPATPVITAPATICSGSTLNLSASTSSSGTSIFNWVFKDGSTATGATQSIPNITVAQSGVYHVTVTINQCTSNDTTVNITVNQTPTKPNTTARSYCQNEIAGALTPSGNNYIWYNNVGLSNGSTTAPTPSTTAVGNTTYYVIDSNLTTGCKSTVANLVVTVNLTPVISLKDTLNPAQCQAANGFIKINGLPANTNFLISYKKNGGSLITLPTQQSDASGTVIISNLTAGTYSNIFLTSSFGCTSNTLPDVTLSDPTKPITPVVTGNTPICSGGNLDLGVSNAYTGTVTYNWSGPGTLSNGNTATPSISNIQISAGGIYSLTITIAGCTSDPGTKQIVVNQTPAAPTTSPIVYCQGATATALVASGTNLIWYNNIALNNGSLIAPTPITTTAGTATYYVVDSSNAGCKSNASNIVVTVNATPFISNPAPTNPQQCQATNGKISFDVAPTTGNYTITYSKDGASQTPITVSPSSGILTIPSLGAGLYENIKVTLNNCPSNTLSAITLTDPTPPATPIILGKDSICSGKNLVLNVASPITNAMYTWTHPNGTSLNNTSYSISNINLSDSGLYKLYVTLNLCKSKDTSFRVRVDSTPVMPTVTTNSPVCTDSAIKLFITSTYPMAVSYTWNGILGFTSLQQNPTISNATMAMAGNYSAFVTSQIGACQSSTATKQVTINQTPHISFKDSSNPTQCATASGSITIQGLLSTTVYTVNYTFNGTPITVSFSTNASGELKIDTLRAGTYSNINVILNNCPSNSIGNYTLVDPTPPATPIILGKDSICSGKNLTLTAASPITNAIYTWIHPNGSSQNNISYTVNNISSSDAGSYKLYVTLNLCKSKDTSFNVRVDSTPVIPTVTTNSPVCTDSTIKLFITNTYPMAVSYTWNGILGFTSLQQNPTISNATMAMAGNYSAFVTSQIGACQSSTATKQVTINQTPHISFKDSSNPTQCATASGSITIQGLLSTTIYTVNYTFNGTPRTVSFSTNASGELKIDTLRAGTYSNINVILNNCPSNSIGSYTLVDPNPPAIPVIIGVDSICSGQNLVLTAASPIANTIYTWTKPNALTATGTSLTINNISVAESGIYKLYVTLNLCQSKDTNLLVRVDSTPVAPIIITNSPVCSDSTIFLQASTVSPGSMNYSWTGANSFTSALQNPTIVNAQLINAGSYSVFATSQIGNCISATSNQNVVVNASPNVASMPDTTYKDGVPSGIIAFSGSVAGTTFSWTNSNPSIGLSASGTGDISFTTSNTTPFPIFGIITVTPSTSFCTGKPITFKITVNPTPRLTSLLNDTICTDNLWQYQATSSTPNVTYTWVRNIIAGISNPASASTDSSGIINETLTNTTTQPITVPYIIKLYSLGSVNTDTVKLTVNPDAKAFYTFKSDKLCAPGIIDSINIKIQPYALANGSFEWYADGVLIGTGLQFPGYTIVNNGDTVKIKLKANSLYGCKSDSFEHSFYNVKTPVASFTKSVANGCGPLTVNFTNTTTPLAYHTYKWDFGNGNTSTLQSPVNIIFREDTSNRRVDTTYYIKLTAYTECDSISYSDSVTVFAPPKALFQPDTTVGCSVFHFRAFNNSWGQHNTYTWDFGDSTALVIDTAYGFYYHNFFTAVTDTFNVKLKAVNKCGSDSFEVKIVVFPNTIVPKLIVDGNSNYGCAPIQVRFVNNTVGANKFTFNFGDGSLPYISNKNPDTVYHTYQNGGNFIATLRAQNSCTDSTVALTLQLYDKPQAKFSLSSNQFCKKETIQFKNLSDSTLSFEWWFGDGGTSTNLHPTHRYLSTGNYTITLIAKSTNPTGAVCTDTLRKTITVHDLPVSSFTSNAAIQNCQPYYFVGITNLLPSEIANWTFSDPFSNDTTQAGNVGVHTFKQVGIYQVQLVIFNVYGCTDTSSTNVKVIETPKVAFAMSDSISCIPGKSVTCNNLTTYSAADAVNYQWYINGVLQATTKDFNYNFNVPVTITTAANFAVKLVAINSYGCRDSVTKLFVIYPKAQPAFAINATVGCVPFNLQFNNASQYANLFNWYLDGQLFSTLAAPNPIVLSNPATTYNIKLVANHTLGCGADSVTKQFTTYTKPIADFLIPNKNSCTGVLNIQCFDLSSVVGASITKWNWIFGDGATDTLKNPTHIYTTAGHFNVGLVATDNRGCKSDIVYQTVANFGKPKANFSVGNVCVRNPLMPVNLSTPGLGSTAITNYLWNFGDGNYLTGSQPIYVYQNEGNYTLTLIVTSDSSCVADTLQKTVTVYGKPTADFKFENNCVNENTLFTNTSLSGFGQSLIGNSKWLFGDGGSSNNYNAAHIFNATGAYVVQLTVSGNRCPNLTDSIKKVVTVYKPRDPVTYPRIEGVRGTPIQLYALTGGVQYNWLPITGLDNAGIQNPIGNYTVAHPNIISYTISITDSLGCKVKDKQEVWLFADADIFVPTAFTPNGDGANDVLKPLYVNIAKINYFRIFDRWGKIVFETSDMGKAWDGTLNGNNLSMETYSWMISAITQQGKELIRKGNVTLIRN